MINIYEILLKNKNMEVHAPILIGGDDVTVKLYNKDYMDNRSIIVIPSSEASKDISHPDTNVYYIDVYGRLCDLRSQLLTKDCVLFPKNGTWEDYTCAANEYFEFGSKIYKIISSRKMDFTSFGNQTQYEVVDIFNDSHEYLQINDNVDIRYLDKIDTAYYKQFQRIVIFDEDISQWRCDIYSHYEPNNMIHYSATGFVLDKFVPYNRFTKDLLGTDNNAEAFYLF